MAALLPRYVQSVADNCLCHEWFRDWFMHSVAKLGKGVVRILHWMLTTAERPPPSLRSITREYNYYKLNVSWLHWGVNWKHGSITALLETTAYLLSWSVLQNVWSLVNIGIHKIKSYFLNSYLVVLPIDVTQQTKLLTHCGRVTQICVFTLQLCKTDEANLLF